MKHVAVRTGIMGDMIKKVKKQDEYVVLVLDTHTARIVSSCCRVYDIMESGVLGTTQPLLSLLFLMKS